MKWLSFGISLLALCSCSPSVKKMDSEKLKVLSTVSMIGDIVKSIGGEDIEQLSLIEGDLDPHTYELVKGDVEKFERADLIFYNGLGLEHGVSLRNQLEGNRKAVALASLILEKEPDAILKTGGAFDPHVWMDISLWAKIVPPIVRALSEKDPQHALEYQKRGEALVQEMQACDLAVYKKIQEIPAEERYLVTCHDAFHYFARRYLATPEERESEAWRERTHAPEGLAPDAELCLSDLALICSIIEKHHIHVLFSESNLNKDSLKKIVTVAKERGQEVRLSPFPLYADSMGEGNSYLMMIQHNVDAIAKELKQ